MSDRKEPYVVEETAGPKALCACGNSGNLPYCDGTHKGTEFSPTIVKIEEDRTVAWCGCRKSGNMPFCDGTHNTL